GFRVVLLSNRVRELLPIARAFCVKDGLHTPSTVDRRATLDNANVRIWHQHEHTRAEERDLLSAQGTRCVVREPPERLRKIAIEGFLAAQTIEKLHKVQSRRCDLGCLGRAEIKWPFFFDRVTASRSGHDNGLSATHERQERSDVCLHL